VRKSPHFCLLLTALTLGSSLRRGNCFIQPKRWSLRFRIASFLLLA